MKNQVFNFIAQTLVHMNVVPAQIVEDADLLFDLNFAILDVDNLFFLLEEHYHLNTPLMCTREVTSLKNLAHYVEYRMAA